MTRGLRLGLVGLVAASVVAATFGGWATITIEDLPEYVIADQPVHLAFKVRQHGNKLLHDLEPTVEARSGSAKRTVRARPSGRDGRYVASVNLPAAQDWTITIESHFYKSSTTLLPLPAIAAGTRPPAAQPLPERGRRLFVAKGCLVCHQHNRVARSGQVPLGPELSQSKYEASYLQQYLANPASKRPNTRMPDLGLEPAEIEALIAFLNGVRTRFHNSDFDTN